MHPYILQVSGVEEQHRLVHQRICTSAHNTKKYSSTYAHHHFASKEHDTLRSIVGGTTVQSRAFCCNSTPPAHLPSLLMRPGGGPSPRTNLAQLCSHLVSTINQHSRRGLIFALSNGQQQHDRWAGGAAVRQAVGSKAKTITETGLLIGGTLCQLGCIAPFPPLTFR